jgi:queuine tRNA-ribosyltransferase
MDIQRVIGADIIMAFDECTPYPCEYSYAKDSMEMTHRWLQRCCARFDDTEPKYAYEQSLFPIVQGSTYPDCAKNLRRPLRLLTVPEMPSAACQLGSPQKICMP